MNLRLSGRLLARKALLNFIGQAVPLLECVPLMKLGQQERVVLIQVQSSRLVGSRLNSSRFKNQEP